MNIVLIIILGAHGGDLVLFIFLLALLQVRDQHRQRSILMQLLLAVILVELALGIADSCLRYHQEVWVIHDHGWLGYADVADVTVS